MSIDQTTRQTSTEQSADMDAAITAHVDSALTMLRTMTLGVITAVNGERVSAQPLLRSVLVNGKEVALPLIVDAPLEFPRGKNWILTFPVQVNDECIIAFSDRAIDAWMQLGGMQTPEYRLHDLRDGVVRVTVANDTRVLSDVSTSAVELRSLDGETKVSLVDNQVTVQANADTKIVIAAGLITLTSAIVNVVGILKVNDVVVTVP